MRRNDSAAMTAMKKARTGLIMNQPFWGSIALHLKLIEDASFPTAATDGRNLWFNADFINSLQPDNVKAVFAHEIGHIVYMHMFRSKSKENKRWQQAADYVVNEMIEKAGFKVMKDWLRHTGFDGKSAEEVYKLLPSSPEQNGQNGFTVSNGNGGTTISATAQQPGDAQAPANQKGNKPLTKAQQSQFEQNIKKIVRQAAAIAKSQGKLPGNISKEIDAQNQEKVPWREVLFNFLSDMVKGDSSWRRPNRRYLPMGLYLPSNESDNDLCRGACYTDASGSVGDDELRLFAGEMTSIIETFPSIALSSRYFDTSVKEIRDEFTADTLPVSLGLDKVGGGTNYRCVFEQIEEEKEDLKFLILFTDLECRRYPDEPPPFPVIWAATAKGYGDPPFGEVVRLYEEASE